MSYWDSSALVKLYVVENDSPQFEQLASDDTRIVTASLARFEVSTTFWRKQAEGAIATGDAELFIQQLDDDTAGGDVEVVMIDDAVAQQFFDVLKTCYTESPPLLIRTNDGLHLAAAKISGETEFVTADIRQRDAAVVLGFTVLPPAPTP
jgi:predicted nucleic acid-binding protein